MEVIHCAIWVSDLDASLTFYCDVLDLKPTRRFVGGDGATNVYVAGPNGVELQLKHDPDRDPRDPDGFDHLAVAVDDTDAAVERVRTETDRPVVRGPLDSAGAGARVAFVEDPDGYGVEFVQAFDGHDSPDQKG